MLRFTTGDILATDAEALVNTVNCVGVMGRGIALQFKKAFPENFRAYARACQRGEVKHGAVFVFETGTLTHPCTIINFPTKRHWRSNSRIEAVEAGLKDLVHVVRDRGIRSMAVPPLGCGLGGLDWSIVRPRIEEALGSLNSLDVVVFEPRPAPDVRRTVRSPVVPKMTPGRAALVGLINRYLGGLLDPFVTLLEVHKLMYFMQVAGEPLKLKFTKAPYGPYAENLRHVLSAIEGYFILGYGDGADEPGKPLQLAPGAVEKAVTVLDRSPCTRQRFDQVAQQEPQRDTLIETCTRQRFDQVAQLVAGFESSFGLELLSTVHWVLVQEKPRSKDELVANVYGWNAHKKCFSPRQIVLAADVMMEKGWRPACV